MPRGRWLERGALVGIVALAVLLRFIQLGHDSLWVDEAFSSRIARLGVTNLLDAAASGDTNPPLYYLVLHFWIDAFGDSEAALRSLSAIVGVALVFVVFKLGERLAGSRAGLTTALFAAVSEFLVHYSQEARVYSLLALLAATSYYFFLGLLDGPRAGPVAGYIGATTALLYAHTYGLFVLGAQIAFVGLALLFRPEWIRGLDARRLGFVLAAPVVFAIPWFVVFAGHVRDEVEGSHEAKLSWLGAPSLRDLPGTFSGYAGSRLALAVVVLALAATAYAVSRRGEGARALAARLFDDRRVGLLVLWIAFCVAVPFVLSVVVIPIYQFKYTIPAAIACYLLLALALESMSVRAGLLTAAVVAVVFLSFTARYYGDYGTEQWRDATTYVARRAAPGDVVIFDSKVAKDGFDYYWSRSDVREVVGSGVSGLSVSDLASVREASGAAARVWLIVSHSRDPDGRIPAVLGQTHRLLSESDFLGIRISRFE